MTKITLKTLIALILCISPSIDTYAVPMTYDAHAIQVFPTTALVESTTGGTSTDVTGNVPPGTTRVGVCSITNKSGVQCRRWDDAALGSLVQVSPGETFRSAVDKYFAKNGNPGVSRNFLSTTSWSDECLGLMYGDDAYVLGPVPGATCGYVQPSDNKCDFSSTDIRFELTGTPDSLDHLSQVVDVQLSCQLPADVRLRTAGDVKITQGLTAVLSSRGKNLVEGVDVVIGDSAVSLPLEASLRGSALAGVYSGSTILVMEIQ